MALNQYYMIGGLKGFDLSLPTSDEMGLYTCTLLNSAAEDPFRSGN